MKKIYLSIILLLCGVYLCAQVTIGSIGAPQKFSVLEVVATDTSPGGLRLPQLTTTQRNTLSQGQTFRDEQGRQTGLAPGLTIYNTTIGCIEYWDGLRWVSMCEQQEQIVEPENPEAIPAGTGTFTGKTCFDVVAINDGINGGGPENCSLIADRIDHKVYFANRVPQDPALGNVEPYSGVQVYTFTPSGSVSKVRFEYADDSGIIIQSMTPNGDYTGNNISTPCKVTVAFFMSLEENLKGLTQQTALKANLYVIYNDLPNGMGTDRKLRITLSFQDCICCGAKTVTNGWLNFMCHNLGANQNVYPLQYNEGFGNTGSGGTLGWLYQWGRFTDGHQLRNSNTTTSLAQNNSATSPTIVQDRFINTSVPLYDWRAGGGNISRWGDGTAITNPPKAVNDPCPAGWKVPSMAQWQSIYKATGNGTPTQATANSWQWFPDNPGYVIGDMMFLPAAGLRTNGPIGTPGSVLDTGDFGYYWSSTVNGTNSYYLEIEQNAVTPLATNGYRAYGFSVRCVEE